jgi:hypothetical protein
LVGFAKRCCGWKEVLRNHVRNCRR